MESVLLPEAKTRWRREEEEEEVDRVEERGIEALLCS
jgi:hypothetical protein